MNASPLRTGSLRLGAVRSHHLTIQLVRFVAVGLLNSAISFGVYVLLERYLSTPAAGAIAFALGAVNGFLLNRTWTFGASGLDGLPRYIVVQGCGAGATSLILWLWTGAGLDHLAGYVVALAIVTPLTFSSNRLWTFRHAAQHRGDVTPG